MTAKEYLQRVRGVQAEVAQLRRLRQRAYEQATRATARPSKAPAHGGNASRDLMADCAEYAAALDRQLLELQRIEREVLGVIEQVPDSRYRRLLRARYVEGKKWEAIALEMHYSYTQVVKYLHPRALACVQDAIECHTPPVI